MGLAVQLLDACERDPDAQPAAARRVCLFASAAAARVVLGGMQGTSYCRIRSVLPICTYHGRTTIHSLDGQAAYVYVGCTYSLPQAQGTARVPTACRPPALLGTLHVALLRNTMAAFTVRCRHGAVWSQAACRMGACRVLPAISVDVVALPTVAAHSEWQCGRLRQKELHVYSAGAVSGSEVPAHSSAWRA